MSEETKLPNGLHELSQDQKPGVVPSTVAPSTLVQGPKPPVSNPIVPRTGPAFPPAKPPTPPPAKPIPRPEVKPDIQLLHKVFQSGNHELTLSIPNKAIHSGPAGANELARCVDPRNGKVYCATPPGMGNGLPEVFSVENVPFKHIKAT